MRDLSRLTDATLVEIRGYFQTRLRNLRGDKSQANVYRFIKDLAADLDAEEARRRPPEQKANLPETVVTGEPAPDFGVLHTPGGTRS